LPLNTRFINVLLFTFVLEVQEKVDDYLKKKGQALAERAKSKWFEEGEKANKYFLNLLKRKKQETLIEELHNGDNVAKTKEEVENMVKDFYTNLYDKDVNLKVDYDSFFPELPQISEEDRLMLDDVITLEELHKTLNECKDSSPGPDGIPYSIYKIGWEVLGPIILNSWNFSKSKGILPDFNRNSTIMLIPKEGKDPKQIGNWRPITLTNCDLKIFTKTISNRVARVLPKIILNTQVAYIPGRVVHDNLRMFEFYSRYCEENKVDAVLVSLDAAKAFDSVNHEYMFETLRRFGFSREFVEMVRFLYNDIKADILVNGFKTTMIRIRKCVKQGDALSCALFIICLDPVLRNIEGNNNIKAIEIVTPLSNKKLEQKTGGYADDVGAAIMNDKMSIDSLFKEYHRFSSYSGIRLNETKSEIMRLGSRTGERQEIEVDTGRSKFKLVTTDKIKICGVTFSWNSRSM